MSKVGGSIVVVLALIAGFVGGWTYEMTLGKKTAGTAGSASDTSSETQSVADCLKEVWGNDKYAAISANSSLATTADNLAALKCYQEE